MPYSRLSDTFAFDPALLAIGDKAFAVVSRCISYCGLQLSDGFVPASVAELFDPGLRTFHALVEAGYFHPAAGGGFTYRHWSEEQRTKQQVLDDRQRQKDRALVAAKGRPRGKNGRFLQPPGGGAPPASSTPIQSYPIQSTEDPEQEAADKPPRVPKKCPCVVALNEFAASSGGRFQPIERVSKGQAVHFQRNLGPIYPPGSGVWNLAGEWVAKGGHNYGNALTAGLILARATDWIEQAKAWERAGRPPFHQSNGKVSSMAGVPAEVEAAAIRLLKGL